MKMKLLYISLLTCSLFATERPPLPQDLRLWKASVISLASTSIIDWHSSRGLYELNPLLSGSNGRFDAAKTVQLKAVLIGSAAGIQWLVLKTTKGKGRRAMTKMNFTIAGLHAGVAIRNYKLAIK